MSWMDNIRWHTVEGWLVAGAVLAIVIPIGMYIARNGGLGPLRNRDGNLPKTRELNPGFEIDEGIHTTGQGRRTHTRYFDIREKATGRAARIRTEGLDSYRFQFVECPPNLPAPPGARHPVCVKWQNDFGEQMALCFEHDDEEAVSRFLEELAEKSTPGQRGLSWLEKFATIRLFPDAPR